METVTSFDQLNLSNQLLKAIDDLGFKQPTPIQLKTYSVIRSGKDIVGIAQTGTGKTLAYSLPILQDLKFSKQVNPRVLILVPTRELVVQVVGQLEDMTKYTNVRVLGVYGGVNIKTQSQQVSEGVDVLVATPGRLYDLALTRVLQLKEVKKLVIDEVDVMLDLGFRFQLTNIFELLPERRQNIMFSATMTNEIDAIINLFFIVPTKISIALSGTPLENIAQQCYEVKNFYTKVNLLAHLLTDGDEFNKVLVFVGSKKIADRLFSALEENYTSELGVVHSNKSQNYRLRSIQEFADGTLRVLIATDVMARGLDIEKTSHVINFDTPDFPENYMHRIGRTGRAGRQGRTILFYTEKEKKAKASIESLMSYSIPEKDFPKEVEVSSQLTPDERPKVVELVNHNRNVKKNLAGPSVHEKKEKNKKINQGGSYKRELAKKYKKPQKRGDKIQNKRSKKK